MSQPQRNDKDKDCESPSASGKTSAAAALEPINDDTSELTRQTTTESNKDPLHIANSTTSKRPHNDSSESRPRQRSKRQSVSGSGDSQTTQGRGIRSSSTSLGKLSVWNLPIILLLEILADQEYSSRVKVSETPQVFLNASSWNQLIRCRTSSSMNLGNDFLKSFESVRNSESNTYLISGGGTVWKEPTTTMRIWIRSTGPGVNEL